MKTAWLCEHTDRRHQCKGLCESCYHKQRYAKNPEFFKQKAKQNRLNSTVPVNPKDRKRRSMKNRHNMTVEQYESLLKIQNNACICGRMFGTTWSEVPRIDHNHGCCPKAQKSCGKCTRGLLCNRCNRVLGFYRNEIHLLPPYLLSHIQRTV